MAVSRINLWRLMSVIFGIKCLLLMVTLGVLMKNSFTIQSIQPTPSPTSVEEEEKSWEESRDFCAAKNSSLLHLKTRNEMQNFMSSSQIYFWIGMHYHKERHAWLWEDGSSPSKDLFPEFSYNKTKNCVVYMPSKTISIEPCENKNHFICKQLPI
ncbi:natural killer cells antigen CD94-like isoform X4 [Microtus pennsylvanicus]|uniref:natural killer cells antigen CD94-like isoform X4 n=1 Tax=Microtus pennsylvanicus TaxID=10058 RepID=UPI003F6C793E